MAATRQDGCHYPRWLPLGKMAATIQDGCHYPRLLPLSKIAVGVNFVITQYIIDLKYSAGRNI